jgi:hypothetical protein
VPQVLITKRAKSESGGTRALELLLEVRFWALAMSLSLDFRAPYPDGKLLLVGVHRRFRCSVLRSDATTEIACIIVDAEACGKSKMVRTATCGWAEGRPKHI